MARNRYDIDEVMEDHFDLGQLKGYGPGGLSHALRKCAYHAHSPFFHDGDE